MSANGNGLHLNPNKLAQLKRTMQPLPEAETLPPWCYTSQEFYQAEVQNIFLKEWIGVGRVDEIPNPGDYKCAEIADEPIVVIRNKQGEVRGFSRACRHRGACVVEGSGNAENFVCPFHGWTYDLRGNLIGAPQMNRTGDFNRKEWSLPEIRVEIWQGMIFVNFDLDAEPLAPRVSRLSEIFANYKLGDLRATKRMSFWNECNWKLSTEQAIDMYHVPDIHFSPKTWPVIAGTHGEDDPDGQWTTSFTEQELSFPHVTGSNSMTSPFPAIEGLSPLEMKSFNMFLIYPCTLIAAVPDGALSLSFYPQGVNRTNVTLDIYYPPSAFETADFDRHLEEAQEGFIVTNNQDMVGARLTHRGMRSRLLNPGRFSYLERTTWQLGRYVIRRVVGEQALN